MRSTGRAAIRLGAVLLVGMLCITAAAAQTAPAGGSWVPIFDFDLEVDGKLAPDARFFVEARGPRLVVSDPGLENAALIDRSTKTVIAVDSDKIEVDLNEDTLNISEGATDNAPTTTFTINSAEVVFYLGSNRLKILPKNPLVGAATLDEILSHSPVYRRGIELYEPEDDALARLRSIESPVDIEVFFGTWCSHCKILVPKFIKVMRMVDNQNLKISWMGVPKSFGSYPPAQSNGVRGIPTFIFYRDGKELGRIPGDPGEDTIEKAMADILRPNGE